MSRRKRTAHPWASIIASSSRNREPIKEIRGFSSLNWLLVRREADIFERFARVGLGVRASSVLPAGITRPYGVRFDKFFPSNPSNSGGTTLNGTSFAGVVKPTQQVVEGPVLEHQNHDLFDLAQ
jgi:hypothetical protein